MLLPTATHAPRAERSERQGHPQSLDAAAPRLVASEQTPRPSWPPVEITMGEPALVVVPVAAVHALIETVVRCAFDEALADRVAEAVVRRLGAASPAADVFSSGKRGVHIPGKSRRWMVRNLRTMPGARKVGRDWQITRVDYERWMTEQDVQECRTATVRTVPANAHEIALKALAKAGLRPTRGP